MRWSALALAAVAIAFAWPQQEGGWEENAHYALVLALADASPYIDDVRSQIGGIGTGDVARYRGHVYAITAPGQPLASVPHFFVLRELGMRVAGEPTQPRWAAGLVSVALPAFLLLLLVRRVADGLAPGYGTATAVVFGLGTLLLPFATMFMSHALSAFLAFGSFALLWREPRLVRVFAAGAVAGLAVATEYQNALAALVLGAYAIASTPRVARAAAYVAGAVLGVLPAALYHQWAFGTPFHAAYLSGPAHGAFDRGLYGFDVPSGGALLEMLFSEQGLFVLSPVLACGILGTVLLYRGGNRAEAVTVGAIGALYLVYASGFFTPFGGIWPGPRYLIVTLPFLFAPAALTFRALPVTSLALALPSIAIMVALTATHAHAAYHMRWFQRVAEREFTTTALQVVGITGWYSMLPFFAAAVAAVFAAWKTLPRLRVASVDAVAAATSVAAWAAIFAGAPRRGELGGTGLEPGSYWPVALVALGAVAVVVGSRLRGGGRPRLAA